ncbi:MAG: patatin-like phospholipase family protein [Candidatus Margulisbacteria bacterium]|nr:patatin-like phospholipase family protein [Candidatus Margulisiibacteriota bacterium]
MSDSSQIGLVLTGGGARGAYQAGVIRAITEITDDMGIVNPFPVLTGTSAGAINATYLSSFAEDMTIASKRLVRLWTRISTKQVYRIDLLSMAGIGLRWLLELSSGGLSPKKKARALLNTEPLMELIQRGIKFQKIQENIDKGYIHSLALTAVNYSSGNSRTFFQGGAGVEPWERLRRKGLAANITPEHIMASTAIPMLFPPIKLDGQYYGDGSLRNYTPLSPAIKLGAQKLIVVGVRRKENKLMEHMDMSPTPARILGVLLNSVLLDAIDYDYERLTRINHTLKFVHETAETPLKKVDVLMIRPSQDLGIIASEEAEHMPKTILHFIHGLGTSQEASDLISYLLFEPSYTGRLIELGQKDAMEKETDIRAFFHQ